MLKSVLLGLTLYCFSLTSCYISYHHNRTRLFNGFCLVIAFFSLIGGFLINTIHFTWHNLYCWNLGIVIVGLLSCCLLYCLQNNFSKRKLIFWAQKNHVVDFYLLIISILILSIFGLSWLGWSELLSKINHLFFLSLCLIFTYFLFFLQKGIDPHQILLEKHSHNTYENMLFSKKIIAQKGLTFNRGLFVTSNHHVYRAGLMAHQVGLNIAGLGSKTHFLFWYRALGREFAAILLRYKYLHLLSIVGLIILTINIFF